MEHDNLRAALTWYTSQADGVEPALLMAGYLWRFWEMRGHWTEGRRWLDKALARRAEAAPSVRWIPLHGAGNLACTQGEYEQAQVFYEESLTVTRELDHKYGMANSLLNLGYVSSTTETMRRREHFTRKHYSSTASWAVKSVLRLHSTT